VMQPSRRQFRNCAHGNPIRLGMGANDNRSTDASIPLSE
jgi:hypothetical protein